MPRYFFNTRIGDELISDPEGEVLGDPDRAWEMARAMIRELLKTEGADGALLSAVIEVTDDSGEIVLEFPFTEAILDIPDRSDYKALTQQRSGCALHRRLASIPARFPIAHRRINIGECVQESHRRRDRACPREEIRPSVRGEQS